VHYSEKFKRRMIERLTSPSGPSATKLSTEVGVSQATLSRWLRQARRLPAMRNDDHSNATPPDSVPPRAPRSWSAQEKYKVVVEAAAIADADLGEFLRKKGLHAAQLEEWRAVVAEAAQAALGARKKPRREQPKIDPRRVRELERELHRKDKALAEMAALIALKKKLELLWGDEDESTPKRNEPWS
jgi:transposase